MHSSTLKDQRLERRKRLVDSLGTLARKQFSSDAQWARACGVPPETLSRLRSRLTCDVSTLWALADGADCAIVAVPGSVQADPNGQKPFGREQELPLVELCASGSLNANDWRAYGESFLMGGLATLLASARPFDRQRYLRLAEEMHIGITTPDVFAIWLERSPIRPARFLPMVRARLSQANAHASS